MRLIYSVGGAAITYLLTPCFTTALIVGALVFIIYLPLPTNVDNFFAMYFLMKSIKVGEFTALMKLKLGYFKTELEMRRTGLDQIRPKCVRGVNVEIKKMENYDLYIYTPEDIKTNGAVIYYHGGGFTVMQVATYQKFLSAMAKDLGCKIFSPNYRLAPETPYPIGDMDSYHATKHVFDNTKLYRLDKNKIAMSGDSAGGFLTVVTWFRLKKYFKENNVKPSLLSLVYPALGYKFDTPSYQRNGKMPILNIPDVLFYYLCHGGWEHTAARWNILANNEHVDETKVSHKFRRNLDLEKWLDEDERKDWLKPKPLRKNFTPEEQKFKDEIMAVIEDVTFVPLNMTDDELGDMPPVKTYICEHDVLKNEGQVLHARLKNIGKESDLILFKGAFHGQMMFSQKFLGLKAFKRTTKEFDGYITDFTSYIS